MKSGEKTGDDLRPPRAGIALLRIIYDESLFEEVYGDLHEIYAERLDEDGRFRASFHFMIDALLSIRNYDLKKNKYPMKTDVLAMLKIYLKGTLRAVSKNKVYSGLNIMGLALGIAACLFILQYVAYERSYDRFHVNHEDLYRIQYKIYRDGALHIHCAAAVPRVGPFMAEKMPEVRAFARAYPMSGVVTYRDIKFREERMHMADPAFLQIFTFPLIQGDPQTALKDPNTVVLSKSASRKYFGADDPMGKTLRIDGRYDVQVTGIARDVPDNSHIKFDFLISYETLNNQTRNEDGSAASETAWGWYDFNTYVLLQPGTDPLDFDRRFGKLVEEERKEFFAKYNYRSEFPLQRITDIHLYSNLLQESEPEEQGDGEAVSFLTLIAFFILIIAWINYVNLATARSVERAGEVGVRKTLGANRRQLIFQFLTEAFVLNFISLIIGLLIVVAGVNYFNQLTASSINLAFLRDGYFWMAIAAILGIGSVLSGLYPAFILSSFNPVLVLKGKLSSRNAGVFLRKVLVVFQFAASVTLIAGTLVVYRQLSHLKKMDLGFDMTNTLVVKGPDVLGNDTLFESTKETFKRELLKNGRIGSITAASNVPGDEIFWTNGIKRQEEPDDRIRTIYNVGIDYSYFNTFDIDLVAGRNYDKNFGTDTMALILNNAAVKFLGFESPEAAIDQKVTFWGGTRNIIGVVNDYNQMSAKSKFSPIAFPLALRASTYFTMKLRGDDYQPVFSDVKNAYERFFPGNPFDYFFLDEFFNRQYNNDTKFSRVFTLFAGFAIFVACLGLFGLSSFNALKRTKEIGIRKILGANTGSVVRLLSKEFIFLVVISNLIAWPVIHLIMNRWLENFANHITIGLPVYLLAGLLVFLIAMLTVSYKTISTALANPIDSIRYE
jgi:putative ABC transport system permease protein